MLLVSRFEEFSSPHINILDCTAPPFFCALASRHCLQCSSKLEHLTVRDLTIFSLAAGIFHAARLEVLAFFKCAHRYLGLYTFSHSLRSIISPSPSMQLEIGAPYSVRSFTFFICWYHLPCSSFRGPRNFQVRTSISSTVLHLTLFAPYLASHYRIQCTPKLEHLALNLLRQLATLNDTPLAPRCERLVFMQPRLHRVFYKTSLARDNLYRDISYNLTTANTYVKWPKYVNTIESTSLPKRAAHLAPKPRREPAVQYPAQPRTKRALIVYLFRGSWYISHNNLKTG